MAANVVDSLIISLGLDPSEVRTGLQEVTVLLGGLDAQTADFVNGFIEGFREEVAAMAKLSSSAGETGAAVVIAANKGKEELDSAVQSIAKVKEKFDDVKKSSDSVAQSFGRNLGGFLKGLAAPLIGFETLRRVIGGAANEIDELDKLSQKNNLTKEESIRKQALLGRYNKEALENYRGAKKAFEGLSDSFYRGAAIIMNAVTPAINWMLEAITKVIRSFTRNEKTMIVFITAIAAAMTKLLIPSIIKAGLAFKTSILPMIAPFLPLIAVVGILALLIDDLWAYMRGGKSALADFWAVFGTGEEISEALSAAWETLKAVGSALWNGMKESVAGFFSYFGNSWNAWKEMIKSGLKLIKTLFTGDFDAILAAALDLAGKIKDYLAKILADFGTLCLKAFNQILADL
jgi:hypothetical protein